MNAVCHRVTCGRKQLGHHIADKTSRRRTCRGVGLEAKAVGSANGALTFLAGRREAISFDETIGRGVRCWSPNGTEGTFPGSHVFFGLIVLCYGGVCVGVPYLLLMCGCG